MADERSKISAFKQWRAEKGERGFMRFRNILKTAYNRMRGKTTWHHMLVPERELSAATVYRQLNLDIGFEEIAGLNRELREIEDRTLALSEMMAEIMEIYFKLGPYTNEELANFELNLYIFGTTGFNTDTGKFEEDKKNELHLEEKDFIIEPPGIKGLEVKIPFPRTIDVPYPDGNVHSLTIYGRRRIDDWKRKYELFLKNEIVKELEPRIIKHLSEGKEANQVEEIKRSVGDNFEVLSGAYTIASSALLGEYSECKEAAYESHLKNTILPFFNRLNDLRGAIMKLLPPKVKYNHTYKIVKRHNYVYDFKNPRVENFKDVASNLGFKKLPEEEEIGLDENGWPLEVDENGNVLLDKWHKRTVRKVPSEWIEDCDLLCVVNWVLNEYDSYRDDLRDGRYHPGSLTAIDYAMANNPSKWGEWKGKRESRLSEEYQSYQMRGESIVIGGKREPSNLSPAFDKRALKRGISNWVHCGRKRYYAYPDAIYEAVGEEGNEFFHQIITTRGAAMYIIERVTREMKFTPEQAHKVLLKISETTGGLDYGPRKFGTPLHKDPFNVDVSALNQPKEGYKKPEWFEWRPEVIGAGRCVISERSRE